MPLYQSKPTPTPTPTPTPSVNKTTPAASPASPASTPSSPSISPSGLVNKVENIMKGPTLGEKIIQKAKDLISPSVNGKKSKNNGFTYITISGDPKKRGFTHGKLLGERIITFFRTFAFFIWDETGRDVRFFMKMLNDFFKKIVEEKYKECYEEMQGIAEGLASFVKENPQVKDQNDEVMVKDGKIILHKKSYVDIKQSNTKEGYTTDGIILIDINVDVIFLLNNIVSLDYLYSKLSVLIPNMKELQGDPMYADFMPDTKPISSSVDESPGNSMSLREIFLGGGGGDRCSAFMAVGKSHTENGEVVCAHITFDNFITGQFNTIILYIDNSSSPPSSSVSSSVPQKTTPNSILMQTFPGGIWSSTDFFVTTAGFIGTETTIGGFNAFELHAPICVRARRAMEYSKTLDDYEKYFKENNSGDYANTWYIAKVASLETNTSPSPSPSPSSSSTTPSTTPPKSEDEIMRIELGVKYVNVERTKDGYFIGFNACYDARIRNLECSNDGYYDIRRHSGSRRVRLEQLMRQYKGKINAQTAKLIISDHMDVYTNKDLKCSRTVCAHYELDGREYMSQESRPKPFQPRGAVDAKICTSSLCRNIKFLARWGNACGTPFKKKEFCDKNIQWEYQLTFLEDRDRQPWSFCSAVGMNESSEKIDKAIESDSDKTGYDLDSGKNTSSPTTSSPSSSSSSINKSMSPVTSPLSSPLPSPSRLNLASNNVKPNKKTTITPTNNLPTQNPQLNPQPTLQLNPQLNLQQNPQPTLQQNLQQKHNNLHSDSAHDLLTSSYHTGGSFVSENKKQMKEFMKMIKTKNGTKPKNKNTRRSKHNKSNKDQ